MNKETPEQVANRLYNPDSVFSESDKKFIKALQDAFILGVRLQSEQERKYTEEEVIAMLNDYVNHLNNHFMGDNIDYIKHWLKNYTPKTEI